MQKNLFINKEELKMKIYRTDYNKLLKELESIKEELKATKKSAEIAAENARKVGNDELASRCNDRCESLAPQLSKVEEILEIYDK